jgi:hypothetical protein
MILGLISTSTASFADSAKLGASCEVADLSLRKPILAKIVEGEFTARFGDLDEPEVEIHKTVRPYAMKLSAQRREWAHLLPTINEQFPGYSIDEQKGTTKSIVNLTPMQTSFYNDLLNEAIEKVQEEIKKSKSLRKKLEKDDEEAEEAIDAALRKHLQKVEKFLVNPTENAAFKALNPKGLDAISPKIPIITRILRAHFGKEKDRELNINPDPNNKVLIFGYNTCASVHVFENLPPDLKKMAIHVVASKKKDSLPESMIRDEGIEEFKKNPNVKIMVADEASMQMGHNLQIASRFIRLQILWTPGEMDQAVSRVVRPDPRGIYNRKEINYDLILVNNTLDVAKMGRIISRIIDKARFDELGNKEFERIKDKIRGVELLKMNLDPNSKKFIGRFSNFDQIIRHIDAYTDLRTWEDEQFEASRSRLIESLSKKYGRKISLEEAKKLAMRPVDVDGKSSLGTLKLYPCSLQHLYSSFQRPNRM